MRRIISILALVACVALSTSVRSQVRDFVPITDAALQRPDAADWIHWRRTTDGWGYSPLDSITRRNVARLQLVWSAASPSGSGQETPLVYRGVMYWPTTTGVRALDAATGRLLWEYRSREASLPGTTSSAQSFGIARRSIAIYADKIIAGTSDAHLIALDARTGALVWRQRVADRALGYQYTSGPIIAKGKVIGGMTGTPLAGGSTWPCRRAQDGRSDGARRATTFLRFAAPSQAGRRFMCTRCPNADCGRRRGFARGLSVAPELKLEPTACQRLSPRVQSAERLRPIRPLSDTEARPGPALHPECAV